MSQSATRVENVKWNISVPPDFDEATRIYPASQGGKKILFLLWSKKRFSSTSCLHSQEKPKKRCTHPDSRNMNLTRLLRMGLPELRTKQDEGRS